MRRFVPSPGMRARTPIVSGASLVSQTLIVAHRWEARRASAGAAPTSTSSATDRSRIVRRGISVIEVTQARKLRSIGLPGPYACPRLALMPRLLTLLASLVVTAVLVLPASAMALAGGSTGGGGGGGGGGSSGGGFSSSGGSGSSCTGDNCAGGGWIVLIVFGGIILFVGASALGAAWQKARMERKLGKVEDAAKAAHADDGYWDPHHLKQCVREAFFPIQNSWENRSVEESRPYCSDGLYERHKLQLEGLEKQNRVNRIQDLNLQSVDLVRIHNVTEDQYHMGQVVNDDQGEPTYGEDQGVHQRPPVPS